VVKPGFNSGRIQVMDPLSRNADQLVKLPGAHYADPIFSWKNPVAITDIEFMKSSVLGERYKNNILLEIIIIVIYIILKSTVQEQESNLISVNNRLDCLVW